jgi:poly(3-hydroxybutyrate) depolymerase
MKTVQKRQSSIRNFAFLLAFIAVCFCAAARVGAQSPTQKATPKSDTDESFSIQVGESERRYVLHLPAPYNKNKPMPLVCVFHGGGGTPQSAHRPRFGELSDKFLSLGFLVR